MKTLLTIVAVGAIAIGGIERVQAAAEFYWDADGDASSATGGSGNWDTTSLTWRIGSSAGTLTNWLDGSAPRFGGTAGTVTLKANVAVDGAHYGSGAGIEFNTTGYIVNADPGYNLTINSGGDRPFYANNTVTLNTPLYLASTSNVYFEGSNVNVNGNISVGGTSTTVAGWGGTLTLSGNNSFGSNGGNGGYYYNMVIGSNGALGSGALNVTPFPGSYGNTLAAGPSNPTINVTSMLTNWDQELRFAGTNSLTLANNVTYLSLTADTINCFRINVQQATATLTFAGLTEADYNRPGGFRKMGPGTVVINGQFGNGGKTYVTDGTLILNGPTGDKISSTPTYQGQQDYLVYAGATLGGTGTINLASGKSVTVNAGGTLAPGNSPGVLTINGNLNLNGTYQVDVGAYSASNSPATFDQTRLTGTGVLSLGATSALQALDWQGMAAYYTTGTWYPILTYTSLFGTFGSVSGLYAVNYNFSSVNYPGQWVAIQVPEPATLVLLGLGAAGLLARRRRR